MKRYLSFLFAIILLCSATHAQTKVRATNQLINAQTGTTYAITAVNAGKLITACNSSAQAYSIAQAGSTGFPSGWFVDIKNICAGAVTITPTTSTVDGAATLVLTTGKSIRITSNGTHYRTGLGGLAFATATDVSATIYAVDSVGTDAFAITPAPPITSYTDGLLISFRANVANADGATLAVSGLAAKALVKSAGGLSTALATNDIRANQIVIAQYSSVADNFQVQSTLGNAGGGASPLTTKGDLFGHSTVDARIPVGANGTVLTADSGETLGLKWAAILEATNSAGANVVPKSDGTNLVASQITDSGSAVTITREAGANLLMTGAGSSLSLTAEDEGESAQIDLETPDGGLQFKVLDTTASVTVSGGMAGGLAVKLGAESKLTLAQSPSNDWSIGFVPSDSFIDAISSDMRLETGGGSITIGDPADQGGGNYIKMDDGAALFSFGNTNGTDPDITYFQVTNTGIATIQKAYQLTPLAFASLPTPAEGMMAWITDSDGDAWGDVVTGGGALKRLIVFDGSAWHVFGK